jgi:hypothetical protein
MSAVIKCPQVVVIAALLFSGLSSPSVTAAMQAKTSLHVGGKVRYKLDAPRANWREGELTGLDADTLRLVARDGGGRAVATPQIRALQVSSGLRSNAGRGAMIGGILGATLGLGLGFAASSDSCTGFCPAPDIGAREVVAVTAILGGVGAGIGALIGATSRRDRWDEVPRPWSVAPAGP